MGFLDFLGIGPKRLDQLDTFGSVGVLSPYADTSGLGTIVISDAFGIDATGLMDRSAALKIPGVARARGLITSTASKLPLRAVNSDDTLVTVQPSWLYRTDGDVSPYDRMAATVDDLIFYGYSLWLVVRGADGFILNAAHCPLDQWRVADGKFFLEGRDAPLDESEIILFNPPTVDGLLALGSENLRGARDVERAWQARAKNPIPMVVLQVTDDGNLTQDEVDEYVRQWSAARQSPNGAVGFLPQGITMQTFGDADPALMTEGRNATRTDIAAYLGIPAAMLDGTLSEASLTYTTQEGTRNRFYEESIPIWTGPIEARLSQDDVVPRGQRVRFDVSQEYALTPAPTGASMED